MQLIRLHNNAKYSPKCAHPYAPYETAAQQPFGVTCKVIVCSPVPRESGQSKGQAAAQQATSGRVTDYVEAQSVLFIQDDLHQIEAIYVNNSGKFLVRVYEEQLIADGKFFNFRNER